MVDEALARVDLSGRTTRVARSVLAQMFAMAVRHDALTANPMREVRRAPRRRRAVQALTVEQARDLLGLTRSHRDGVARDARGLLLGGTRRTSDLHDLVLVLLGTGMRIGEALALRVGRRRPGRRHPVRTRGRHHGRAPPRCRHRTGLRSWASSSADDQDRCGSQYRVAARRRGDVGRRRARTPAQLEHQPVFPHTGGGWLWPNNVRTKLRGVVAGTPLAGVSPHTLRRTVGTLVAHGAGLDAARDVLGHRDPSVTARHYVADTGRVIDVRRNAGPDLRLTLWCVWRGCGTALPSRKRSTKVGRIDSLGNSSPAVGRGKGACIAPADRPHPDVRTCR